MPHSPSVFSGKSRARSNWNCGHPGYPGSAARKAITPTARRPAPRRSGRRRPTGSGSASSSGTVVHGGGQVTVQGATLSNDIQGGTVSGAGEVELGEPPPAGPGSDELRVTAGVVLDGALEVSPLAGFSPAAGAEFTILTSQSRTGGFSTTESAGALGPTLRYAGGSAVLEMP
jgi:hypothetical protein